MIAASESHQSANQCFYGDQWSAIGQDFQMSNEDDFSCVIACSCDNCKSNIWAAGR